MKIKKEFLDLIYNGTKQYEFRNSNDKEGIYKIKDKYFQLELDHIYSRITFRIENIDNKDEYYILGYKVDKETFEWVKNNIDYFINKNNEFCVCVYVWNEVEKFKHKELEIIGE